MEKILSIVIPTKNRYSTLLPVVKALLDWPDADFEVVVQDNSTNNTPIQPLLKERSNDKRFRYFYVSRTMTAPENCDLAIKNAQGEYVCFIGDDDGVAHASLTLTRWMKDAGVDSAYSNFALYSWPDLEDKNYGFAFSGQLHVVPYGSAFCLLDALTELKNLLHDGALSIRLVPRAYHGFVRKSSLDRLFNHTGTYFPGPVPDMANAVGLVPFVKKHIFADYPFIMAGASSHSMAGKGALKKHAGSLQNEKSLPPETEANWSEILPKYWSAQTIWAESALKALQKVGLKDLATEFNLEKNLAACLMYVPKYRTETWLKIKALKAERKIRFYKISWYFLQLCTVRTRSLTLAWAAILLRRRPDMHFSEHCVDAGEAMKALDRHLNQQPMRYILK